MKKILITGAAGALGRAVLQELKKVKEYHLTATCKASNLVVDDKVHWVSCDVSDLGQLTAAFNSSKPDLILHLGAAFTLENVSDAYQSNVAPAAHLLELVQNSNLTTRVVLIGASAEYGAVTPEQNPITEECALYPVSWYGLSKAWQSQLLGFYANRGVDVVCARIFNLYGPGLSNRLFAGRLQNQINAVKRGHQSVIEVGALESIRDYLSTEEAARQLMAIALKGASGNVYHIASGQPISMRDFLLFQLKLNNLSTSLIHESAAHSNHQGYDVKVLYADMQKTWDLDSDLKQSKK